MFWTFSMSFMSFPNLEAKKVKQWMVFEAHTWRVQNPCWLNFLCVPKLKNTKEYKIQNTKEKCVKVEKRKKSWKIYKVVKRGCKAKEFTNPKSKSKVQGQV